MALHERLLAKFVARNVAADYDRIDAPAAPVIIAGYGRFGQIVSRVLRMCGIPFTALEASYAQVDFVRRYGNRIYYGDASRRSCCTRPRRARPASSCSRSTMSRLREDGRDREAPFPQLEVLARARNRVHYFRLRDLGVRTIYRDTFPASLELAHQALLRMGFGVPPRSARSVFSASTTSRS